MATKEILIIAENNVEVREYIIDKATNEKYYINEREHRSYGQDRADKEDAALVQEIDYWTNLDLAKYRAEKLAVLTAKKQEIAQIKSELAKAKSSAAEPEGPIKPIINKG